MGDCSSDSGEQEKNSPGLIATDQPMFPTSPTPTKPKAGTRKEHKKIQKRYRTNINDKIRELEDTLPEEITTYETQAEENNALRRSKGEVLSRVIEYIEYLQKNTNFHKKKITELEERMRASRRALGM